MFLVSAPTHVLKYKLKRKKKYTKVNINNVPVFSLLTRRMTRRGAWRGAIHAAVDDNFTIGVHLFSYVPKDISPNDFGCDLCLT